MDWFLVDERIVGVKMPTIIAATIMPTIKRTLLPLTNARNPSREYDPRFAPTTTISGPDTGDTTSLAGWSMFVAIENWISSPSPPTADACRGLEFSSTEVGAAIVGCDRGCSRLLEGMISVWPRTGTIVMCTVAEELNIVLCLSCRQPSSKVAARRNVKLV